MDARMLLPVCEFALAATGAILLLQRRVGVTWLPQFLISVGWHGGGKK